MARASKAGWSMIGAIKRWPRKSGDYHVVAMCEECELLRMTDDQGAYKVADAAQHAIRGALKRTRKEDINLFWEGLLAFADSFVVDE